MLDNNINFGIDLFYTSFSSILIRWKIDQDVVGLNLSTGSFLTFVCCLKRPKIREEEAEVGQFLPLYVESFKQAYCVSS